MQSSRCSQTEFSRIPAGPPCSSCSVAIHCLQDEAKLLIMTLLTPQDQVLVPASVLSFSYPFILPPTPPFSIPLSCPSLPRNKCSSWKEQYYLANQNGSHMSCAPLPCHGTSCTYSGNMRTRPIFYLSLYLHILGHEKCLVNVG